MIYAVVPTCRGFKVPVQSVPVRWVIVHDGQERPVEGEAENIVAPDPVFFGRGCDSIRSAGFLHALKADATTILTTDDDCLIEPLWAEQHAAALAQTYHPWSPTLPTIRTRGIPYKTELQPVAISHGLWAGVPDLDARTQENLPYLRVSHSGTWQRIHAPFPQSAMNLGFRREVAAVMYQPAQGADEPFDRFADIWGGLLAQRALTLHGWSFSNGGAVVYHTRASDVAVNKAKEAPGLECHETFWKWVWGFDSPGGDLAHTYAKLAWHVADFAPPKVEWRGYFKNLKDHMIRWLEESGAV